MEPRDVEFGFDSNERCSGGGGSNTCRLMQQGWTGLHMDGRHENASINLHRHFISSRTIVHLLHKYNVPLNVDFISADLDTADLWVVQAILSHGFRPRLFQVEYNSHYPWTAAITFPDPAVMATNLTHWHDKNCASGASARAWLMMFSAFNYLPVAIEPGVDLFFMQKGVADAGRVPAIDLSNHSGVEVHFHLPMSTADAFEMVDYSAYSNSIALGHDQSQALRHGKRNGIRTIMNLVKSRPLTCASVWRKRDSQIHRCYPYRKKNRPCWYEIVGKKFKSPAP